MAPLRALIFGLLILSVAPAHAGFCGEPPPLDVARDSPIIFVGRATSSYAASRFWRFMFGDHGRTVRFEVEEAWGGVDRDEIEITTDRTGPMAYPFGLGQRYLVFASQNYRGPHTDICTRTRPYTEATADIAAMGPSTRDLPWSNRKWGWLGVGALFFSVLVGLGWLSLKARSEAATRTQRGQKAATDPPQSP